jgi:hypothetical protein
MRFPDQTTRDHYSQLQEEEKRRVSLLKRLKKSKEQSEN